MKPKIICISGSTRFIDVMAVLAWLLEKRGIITLGCHLLPEWYTTIAHHQAEAEGCAKILDDLHIKKIDLCDQLLVVNIGGYFGNATRQEVAYAKMAGKPVQWLDWTKIPIDWCMDKTRVDDLTRELWAELWVLHPVLDPS